MVLQITKCIKQILKIHFILKQPMQYTFRMFTASLANPEEVLSMPTYSHKIRSRIVIYYAWDIGSEIQKERSIELPAIEPRICSDPVIFQVNNHFFCVTEKKKI